MQYFPFFASIRQVMETEELILRCKNGEPAARGALYERYADRLLRLCLRYVEDKDAAKDLLHDSFVVIFTHLETLHDNAKAEAWMSRIVRNLSLLYLRQLREQPLPLTPDIAEREPVAEPDSLPEEDVSMDELLSFVDKLPVGYRTVFKLAVLEGKSHQEIADCLGISPHSSSSQLLRARRLLMRMIRERRLRMALLLLGLLPFSRHVRHLTVPGNIVPLAAEKDAPPASRQELATADSRPPLKGTKVQETVSDTARPPLALAPADSLPAREKAAHAPADSASHEERPRRPHFQMPDWNSTHEYRLRKPARWAFTVEMNGNPRLKSTHPHAFALAAGPNVDLPSDGEDVPDGIRPFRDWESLRNYLNGHPQATANPALAAVAELNSGPIVENVRHKPVFTFKLQGERALGEHWGVSCGLSYSRLESESFIGASAYVHQQQTLSYLGISAKGTYHFFRASQSRFSGFVSFGATMELPVSGSVQTAYVLPSAVFDTTRTRLSLPLQWSVEGSLGLQYRINRNFSIVVAPTMHYYFNDGSPVKTVRKEHPFTISLPVGIRFAW